MTVLRMSFAGEIKKADLRKAGDKQLVELSICKKHKGRNGGEDSFTWIRVTLWEPADFMLPKLVKGGFIAGSGEFQLRSYEKDGQKVSAAEVSCRSFDVEVAGPGAPLAPVPTPAKPIVPARAESDDSSPPF